MSSMLKIGNVVTLENGKNYLLLESTKYQGKLYYYAIETNDNDSMLGSYKLFECKVVGDGEYILEINDIVLQETLLKVFKNDIKFLGKKNIISWFIDSLVALISFVLCLLIRFPIKILPLCFLIIMVIHIIRVIVSTINNIEMIKKLQINPVLSEENQW